MRPPSGTTSFSLLAMPLIENGFVGASVPFGKRLHRPVASPPGTWCASGFTHRMQSDLQVGEPLRSLPGIRQFASTAESRWFFEDAERLEQRAERDKLHYDRQIARTTSDILLKVRKLFLEHGKGEGEVSLRKFKQLSAYLITFAPHQDLEKVLIQGLWLLLGAGLPLDERQGPFGVELQSLLTTLELPGYDQRELSHLLKSVVEPSPAPLRIEEETVSRKILNLAFAGGPLEHLSFDKRLRLLGLIDTPMALEMAFKLISMHDGESKREAMIAFAALLSSIEAESGIWQQIQEVLFDVPLWTEYWTLLTSRCRALGELARCCPHTKRSELPAIRDLLIRFSKDLEREVRETTAESLGVLADACADDSATLQMIFERLAVLSRERYAVRNAAFPALAKLASVAPEQREAIVDLLLERSHDEPTEYGEQSAAALISLLRHLDGDPILQKKVASRIIELLRDHLKHRPEVVAKLFVQLGEQLDGTPLAWKKLWKPLLGMAATDDAGQVKLALYAFEAIAKFVPPDSSLRTQICELAQSHLGPEDVNRMIARRALGANLSGDGEDRELLEAEIETTLSSNKGWFERGEAVIALGHLATACHEHLPRIREKLFALLLDEEEQEYVRAKAAQALVKIATQVTPEVEQQLPIVEALLKLSAHAERRLSDVAVTLFGTIIPHLVIDRITMARIRNRLLRLVDDEREHMRNLAYQALETAAAQSASFRACLQEEHTLLVPQHQNVQLLDVDDAARVSLASDEQGDLLTSLDILVEKMRAHEKSINLHPRITVHPDFDPRLVNAHTLLHRLIQAVAISRFALISGPPASGKSEVGRYLAECLGWGCRIVNFHLFTNEEELMQRLGVIAHDGEVRFTITDGPLADALTKGLLFIANEIDLPKQGRLGFLFRYLAERTTTFTYYDPETGWQERPIHPNFRMIATRNRFGPGRKPVNAALKNRAIELAAESYSSLELEALLRSRHRYLERRSPGMAKGLVRLYEDIGRRILARTLEGHAEGYVWNLRHLMRLANALDTSPGQLTAQGMLRITDLTIASLFVERDRKILLEDILPLYEYGGITVRDADIQTYLSDQDKLSVETVFARYGIDADVGRDALRAMGLCDLPSTARLLERLLFALQAGLHPWLKGATGTGKTELVHLAAKLLGAQLYEMTFSSDTDETKIKGDERPTLHEGRPGFRFIPAPLVNALRDAPETDRLVMSFFDEANFAKPAVLEEFNGLLDRDGALWVRNEDGVGLEALPRTPNVRLVFSSNTYGAYNGVNLQSDAFRSRLQEIWVDFDVTVDEGADILWQNR